VAGAEHALEEGGEVEIGVKLREMQAEIGRPDLDGAEIGRPRRRQTLRIAGCKGRVEAAAEADDDAVLYA
jgi:hypothetical protein